VALVGAGASLGKVLRAGGARAASTQTLTVATNMPFTTLDPNTINTSVFPFRNSIFDALIDVKYQALGPLAMQIAFTIVNAILLEAGLSFIGLGIQPPEPSLGLMLQEARGYIRGDAWLAFVQDHGVGAESGC
jgi:hypothetical protein